VIFELLKITFILLIAIPFMYMLYEVTVDISQRFWGFVQLKARPALVSLLAIITRP
jgi:hypothetical protein